MKILIGDKEYTFLKGYQKENKYRDAFNQLSKNIFSLSFEAWYQDGFSPNKNDTYSIKEIHGDDTLFIQKGKTDLFHHNKLMFPLLSHA